MRLHSLRPCMQYHHPSPQHRDTAFYLSYGLLHLTNPCGVMECDEVCEGRNCKVRACLPRA